MGTAASMGIGLFAPPFIRPIWGYLLALMVDLIVVAIFPWI